MVKENKKQHMATNGSINNIFDWLKQITNNKKSWVSFSSEET
jgi:hypothetical protein